LLKQHRASQQQAGAGEQTSTVSAHVTSLCKDAISGSYPHASSRVPEEFLKLESESPTPAELPSDGVPHKETIADDPFRHPIMTLPRRAPSWIFGITSIPYGVCGSFISTLMPYFFRQAGISVESIGWFATA
jgi:hypothetical protein